MSTPQGESELPLQPVLDECVGAFSLATWEVTDAIVHGKEIRNRDMALRSASGVIWALLQTMQFPRDQALLAELARLARQLTGLLDHIVLNAEPKDKGLQALRGLAENEVVWPTLLRPGDEKLTATIIEKLSIGSKAPIGSLRGRKRPPSLATGRNRLALRLVSRIQNLVYAALQIEKGDIVMESSEGEACTNFRIMAAEVPETEHTRLLKLLREAKAHPFSKKNLKPWNRLVVDFVLIIDPELERFPELKRIKSAKGGKYVVSPRAKYRSELSKFFHPALENLLG
jgi:hypothetical protein